MAEPKYPLSEQANLEDNFQELFERMSLQPKDSKPGNFDGYIEQNVAISDTVGTVIYHGLGRIPDIVLPVMKAGPSDIYVVDRQEYQITVQGTAVTTATILIL